MTDWNRRSDNTMSLWEGLVPISHVLFRSAYIQDARQLLFGGHARLGDAVPAAQGHYAQAGALPEMLSICHLFGDPAMRLQ
jgi:hypothetical protein